MEKRRKLFLLAALSCWILLGFLLSWANVAQASSLPQQPTVSIATVTGSPSGPILIVNSDQDQINVRSGPGTDYPIVGVLVAGQRVPALGRSVGGDWVQVSYPGVPGGVAWVYAFLAQIQGNLPIIEPPPTPTPRVTPTIDPTLASQFVIEIQPTRLPTYTPPPPFLIPTYAAAPSLRSPVGVPMGFLIIGLGMVGLLGLFISFLRSR